MKSVEAASSDADRADRVSRRGALAGLLGALATLPARAGTQPPAQRWPGGVVSITYDDGLSSQLDLAAPALMQRGMHGTFYVTWNNIAPRAADWVALGKQGHEIANHTVDHPCDLRPFTPARLAERELKPMRQWLEASFGPAAAQNFAYPCDATDLGHGNANRQARRYARLLQDLGVQSARTTEGPPNSWWWAAHRRFRLQALDVVADIDTLDDVFRYLVRARSEGRWAILVFHDIANAPTDSETTSLDDHGRILDWIRREGMACACVRDVMAGLR
jgi:peptidoglycan/xylan/chitin deacetylase (PgdA/CDA1 family)